MADRQVEKIVQNFEEIVLSEEVVEEELNQIAVNPSTESIETGRDLKYPLSISKSMPGRIIFRSIKVEGANINELIGKGFEKSKNAITEFAEFANDELNPVSVANQSVRRNRSSSVAEQNAEPNTKGELEKNERQQEAFLQSYDNGGVGETVGRVTLPLMKDIKFNDAANYETANLGVLGSALEGFVSSGGSNPFAGVTQDGQFASTATALASQAIAKNAGIALGAVAGGAVGGKAGSLVGAVGLGNSFDRFGEAVSAATRVATAPNQRTLFNNVSIRNFAFGFKMVAKSEREAREIKQIVKFFRQEMYPEKIPLGESGIPLAYKFPNMFEIDILNKNGDHPAFKIQRCYLTNVDTSFNSTATGMFKDGSFVEVDISLRFQEIVALDKQKIRDGY